MKTKIISILMATAFASIFAITFTFLAVSTAAAADLLVSSNDTNEVLRYDGTTGAFVGVFASGGGLDGPVDLVFGPDDNLYVASETTNNVKRFNGTTGVFMDDFVTTNTAALLLPYGLVFGPDHNLYVSSNFFRQSVFRYDGSTGALIDSFAAVGDDPTGIAFGPVDGNLYVGSQADNSIKRFNGATGDFIDVFASTGLSGPRGLVFGPDGHLYVSSFENDRIIKYDGTTGASLGVFASGIELDRPESLTFGPDGHLYVSGDGTTNSVLRYNGTTGAFIDVFASGAELSSPRGLAFIADSPPPPPPFITENRVTTTVAEETNPTLGNDGTNLVVYTEQVIGGLGHILYQRLNSLGAPIGSPVAVSDGSTDDQLNDVSGNFIVYGAFFVGSNAGVVRVVDIGTGATATVSALAPLRAVHISGDVIVWMQGAPGSSMLLMQRISLLGTGTPPSVLSGPAADGVQVGERFVVWHEFIGSSSQIVALEIGAGLILVSTNGFNPSTSGDWIVWHADDGAGNVGVEGRNMSTGELRTIVDSGANNARPTVDGDLVTYDFRPTGQDVDVFVHRLSTDETFQVTNHPADQFENNVFGNLVAYTDNRDNSDIFVASLNLPPGVPPENIPPLANAGIPQTAHPGDTVSLDGSGSSDPDGNTPLTFAWTVTAQPLGSIATLSDSTVSNPTFTFDTLGNYTVALVVTDDLGLPSLPDPVVISTFNTSPIADAGEDQLLTALFISVQLDGTQSFDIDGDDISFAWSLTVPAGSAASLDDSSSATPSFTPDVQGDYLAGLVVTDIFAAASDPVQVTLSFENLVPVADAGGDQSVNAETLVNLDGNGSSDANNDPLTFSWSFVSIPPGSAAVIAGPSSSLTSFFADVEGNYLVSLVVNDGVANSAASNITVLATTAITDVVVKLRELINTINDIPDDSFKNKNLKKALTNKVLAAIELIVEGRKDEARSKLINDIGAKTDGCQTSPSPDKNDWITDCMDQSKLTKLKDEAVMLLDEIP